MLWYEDEQWSGYINIHLERRGTYKGIKVRIGRAPEECLRRALRSEQRALFQARLPAVYERFSDG
jgi:hypothetical protein